MVRSGDFISEYSDDEEKYDSDDSIIEAERNRTKVGVASQHRDGMQYVDTLVNRHNPTDVRLLRKSINKKTGEDLKNKKGLNVKF